MAVEIGSTNLASQRRPLVGDWLHRPISAAVDLLFPPRCVACGGEIEPVCGTLLLCPTCDTELSLSDRPACPRCAMPCSEADLPRGDCGGCRGRRLRFVAARAIGSYQGAMRRAVLKGKHARQEPLAAAMGQRLAEAIQRMPFDEPPDLVVPVPMHWIKGFWRKTNPANTVAQSLARQLGLPCGRGVLVCRRLLRRQATLTPPERQQNVRGAFRVSQWRDIEGQRILLVDDVMTTGATAQECSRMLLDAGAAAVYVTVVARSLPEF